MHGAGNDFVVLDLRGGGTAAPAAELCRALADRHTGVGCDQILTIEDAAQRARRWPLPHLELRRLVHRSNAATARVASPRGWS